MKDTLHFEFKSQQNNVIVIIKTHILFYTPTLPFFSSSAVIICIVSLIFKSFIRRATATLEKFHWSMQKLCSTFACINSSIYFNWKNVRLQEKGTAAEKKDLQIAGWLKIETSEFHE